MALCWWHAALLQGCTEAFSSPATLGPTNLVSSFASDRVVCWKNESEADATSLENAQHAEINGGWCHAEVDVPLKTANVQSVLAFLLQIVACEGPQTGDAGDTVDGDVSAPSSHSLCALCVHTDVSNRTVAVVFASVELAKLLDDGTAKSEPKRRLSREPHPVGPIHRSAGMSGRLPALSCNDPAHGRRCSWPQAPWCRSWKLG